METPIPISPDLIFIAIPFGLRSKPKVKCPSMNSARTVVKGRVNKQFKETQQSHGWIAYLGQNLNVA